MITEARTVPISGRIAEEDFAFLMGHSEGGAVTASEKLRQMANFYRRYHEGMLNYPHAVAEFSRLLEGYRLEAKGVENREKMRSELLDRILTVLPEFMAVLTSADLVSKPGQGRQRLLEVEERIFDLTMNLLEGILRMGITRRSPTYNPSLLRERIESFSELIELAHTHQPKPNQEPTS